MRARRKVLALASVSALASSMVAVPHAEAAVVHEGRIKLGSPGFVLIDSDPQLNSVSAETLIMKFQTRAVGDFKLRFCIGPESDPCGPGSYEATLGPSSDRVALIHGPRFNSQVLFVSIDGTSTTDPVSFTVTIE